MDAHTPRACGPAARWTALFAVLSYCPLAGSPAQAAGYRTANFTVNAASPQLAKEIGDAAENYRRTLAFEWTGRELPNWPEPCPIHAMVHPQAGAGGETSFIFDGGQVFGWRMQVQGSRERVLDSVIPHEVTHTIFASHFRQPLPRWADEGACTTVEHRSEIAKQEHILIEALMTKRGIAFSDMFAMKEYPPDVLPLYAQGHSLARYLIAQRGKRAFMEFLGDGMSDEHWPRAINKHYQYGSLLALQNDWLGWVRNGCPPVKPQGGVLLASTEAETAATVQGGATPQEGGDAPIVRGQEPSADTVASAATPASRGSFVHDPWISGTAPRTAMSEAPVTPTPEQLFGVDDRSVDWPAENQTQASPARGTSVYEAIRQGETIRRKPAATGR